MENTISIYYIYSIYILYILYYTRYTIYYKYILYCKANNFTYYIAYLFSGMVLEGYTQGATYKDYKRAGVGIVFILFTTFSIGVAPIHCNYIPSWKYQFPCM